MIVSENNRIRKEHKEENKVFQIYRVFFSSTQGLTQFVVQSLYKKKILKAPTKLKLEISLVSY